MTFQDSKVGNIQPLSRDRYTTVEERKTSLYNVFLLFLLFFYLGNFSI